MTLSQPPLYWRWFIGTAIFLSVLMAVVTVFLDYHLQPHFVNQTKSELTRCATLASKSFEYALQETPLGLDNIHSQARALSNRTGLRITVLAADGTVIGESSQRFEQFDHPSNQLHQPEVHQAMQYGIGAATRNDAISGGKLMFVAATINQNDQIIGFVRVALPLHEIEQTSSRVRATVAAACLSVGLATIPLMLWLTKRAAKPISDIRAVAERVAIGDFSRRVESEVGGEIGDLGKSLNEVSAQLEAQARDRSDERSELEAVLSNMTEGVLVVGNDNKIHIANYALRQQLQAVGSVEGKTVIEAFRTIALQELIEKTKSQRDVTTCELQVLTPIEKIFLANATRLQKSGGRSAGVVVVLHDITKLKKLENMRKEFVANASHELKTPLSIIKGYVETLLMDELPEPEEIRKFLQKIVKHSNQLEFLLQDLLNISALESHKEKLHLESIRIKDCAAYVAEEISASAQAKSIEIVLQFPPDLPRAKADTHRLQQVFSNLLGNAINYSHRGDKIFVTAKQKENEIEVCVSDHGPGILAEHLPHLFERFYRVDRARSREMGGTGLGLSIVKHIVQAHGGRAWAESEVGKGSSFFFTLPLG